MGTLSSINNWSGYMYGATLLGDPVITEQGIYMWDDSSLPTADIEADQIVLTDPLAGF
jgi:hypothetical protein